MEDDIFKYDGPALGSDPFIENERLLDAVGKLKSEIKTPHALIDVINRFEGIFKSLQVDSYQELNQTLVNWIRDRLGAERASLLEVDHSTQTLFFRTVCDLTPTMLLDVRVPMTEGIAGIVLDTKMPYIEGQISEATKRCRTVENLVGFKVKNLVALPLVAAGRIFGVIEVLNISSTEQEWFKDLKFWEALAQTLSLFLEVRLLRSMVLPSGNAPETTDTEMDIDQKAA